MRQPVTVLARVHTTLPGPAVPDAEGVEQADTLYGTGDVADVSGAGATVSTVNRVRTGATRRRHTQAPHRRHTHR